MVRVKKRVGEGKSDDWAMGIVEVIRYIIRLAKGNAFADRKQSDTARLFENHGYKNKKQAVGSFSNKIVTFAY